MPCSVLPKQTTPGCGLILHFPASFWVVFSVWLTRRLPHAMTNQRSSKISESKGHSAEFRPVVWSPLYLREIAKLKIFACGDNNVIWSTNNLIFAFFTASALCVMHRTINSDDTVGWIFAKTQIIWWKLSFQAKCHITPASMKNLIHPCSTES